MEYIKNLEIDFIDFLPFSERPFRAKFVPAKVWDGLDTYRNDAKGLSNYCKKWKTTVKFAVNKSKSNKQYVAVGGEYDPETRRNTVLVYCDSFDAFEFTPKTWERFKYKFIQTIMHEFVHFMQYDRRYNEGTEYHYQFKRSASRRNNYDREYYSHFDEIQAYAHCIYLDYRCKYPNKTVEELLVSCKKRSNSPTLTSILRVFNYDYRNNSCLNKLLSEVYRWSRRYDRYNAA